MVGQRDLNTIVLEMAVNKEMLNHGSKLLPLVHRDLSRRNEVQPFCIS